MAITNAHSAITKQSAAKGRPKMSRSASEHTKVGFFSGTFDPVHTGHIAFIQEAIKQCGLSKVLLLPEEVPRGKQNVTPYSDRLAMLRLALTNTPDISIQVLPMPTFSVSATLPLVQAMAPGAQLVFLCGSDVVKTFVYRWEGFGELVATCQIIVGLRNNETATEVEEIMKQVAPSSTWQAIHAPKHLLASTHIRQGNHTIEDIDPKVADYITYNNLYS